MKKWSESCLSNHIGIVINSIGIFFIIGRKRAKKVKSTTLSNEIDTMTNFGQKSILGSVFG